MLPAQTRKKSIVTGGRQYKSLDDVLHGLLGRLSDGSLKVGVQGLDANRWRIDDILYVFEAYVAYSEVALRTLGIRVPPVDVWGGGQVSQVPRFLGEDPYENLSRLSSVAGRPPLKCIYRGRQGFGFLPCSNEIQEIAVTEAVNRGMSVFRTFDPMNDERNLQTSINVIKRIRQSQLDVGMDPMFAARAEALVFYVRPPSNQKPVSDLDTMSRYATKLCEMGFHELAVADYANQLSDKDVTSRVFESLRGALDMSGFQEVPLNLFAQGCSPAIVLAALENGATTADVAIGDLSGTLSNPDMHDVIQHALEKTNCRYTNREHKDHPVLQALETVRQRIQTASQKHLSNRIPECDLNPEITRSSRLAFNAVGALHSAIQKNWDQLLENPTKVANPKINKTDRQATYLNAVLEKTRELWLDGGQFNMVSPIGFFCSFQAERLVRADICGIPLSPILFTQEFRSILKGRYGRNIGLENGIGDTGLAKAMHVLEFLDVLREQDEGTIDQVMSLTGLSSVFSTTSQSNNKISLHNIELDARTFPELMGTDKKKILLLLESELQNGPLKDRLRFALSPNRFPSPTETLEDGRVAISKIINIQSNIGLLREHDQCLTEIDRLALYAILFKVNESDPFVIVKELLKRRQDASLVGIDCRDVQHVGYLFSTEINLLAQLNLKKRALKQYVWRTQKRSRHHARTLEGLNGIQKKTELLAARIFKKVEAQIAASNSSINTDRTSFTHNAITVLLSSALEAENAQLLETPPDLWKITDVKFKNNWTP